MAPRTDAVDDIDNGGREEPINDSLRLDDLDTAFDPGDTRAPAGVFTISYALINLTDAESSNPGTSRSWWVTPRPSWPTGCRCG